MELVIAEKPSVAQSIAAVLGATQRKDGYLEGNEYLVSWCVGHLVELAQPESYEEAWKKWSYKSLPIIPQEWQHEVKSDTKAQYQILKKLMHDDRVDAVVCATDAGREGELIFRLTYNMAGCRKPMKRLWISSMEESAIRDGFHNLRPGSDYDNLYHSALCRQEADWLVGINGTRLFTVLYGGKALKVDRVQTPTLAMLVDRESKIMNFKKEAYYMAHIMGNGLDAVSEHISDKTEAGRIAGACENGQALVTSVVKEEKWVAPPKLYDLTTLQRDANRLFGFTAKQTLEYTQSLYEKKLVTYPRTDSQYLSDDMEGTAKNVIEAIFNSLLFEQNIMFNPDIKRILNSKKVTDHHAIIPTMEIIKQDLKAIPESEMKILSLCANRLLCATGEKHIYNSTKAEITCNNTVFKVSGKEVWKNGWKEFEDFFKNSYKTTEDKSDTEEEKKLPELREGMTIAVEQTRVSEHFTQPPKHYTEDSLLSAMERAGAEDMGDEVERKGLDTPATRADIIEKLVKDGFVKREKKQMIPTEDGMKLITILPDVVKSPKLTADWENELTLVSKGEVAAEQFMSGIEAMVSDLVKTYHSVSDEQKAMFGAGRGGQEVLGKCPKCGADVVKGKFGAYCTGKCGMNVGKALGVTLSDSQVKSLLGGKKILVKGLKGKKGSYDAYLIPESIEEFFYTKDGKEIKGFQYKFKMEFPQMNGKQG
ncbi:DNA topoisomerase 3 [Anaerobutyricum hallii]|uniref:DNA topoisomerase 3 n=3 Tax=Lachnospiraceae TaxID=186803 RepID=UPI001D074717|nr:DNA topoisomerase 3 [Anaerobutyricum hallii]MCB6935497.1 DNA topoisomerase 3 [Anaerobutyricum hallii]